MALGRTNCVEFYRSELVRQGDLSNDSWGYLLPFVPGLTLALLGRSLENRPTSHLIALAAFGVAFFLGVAWLNAHTARKLQSQGSAAGSDFAASETESGSDVPPSDIDYGTVSRCAGAIGLDPQALFAVTLTHTSVPLPTGALTMAVVTVATAPIGPPPPACA